MVRISLKRSQKPQKQGIESVISEILHFSGGGRALNYNSQRSVSLHFKHLRFFLQLDSQDIQFIGKISQVGDCVNLLTGSFQNLFRVGQTDAGIVVYVLR